MHVPVIVSDMDLWWLVAYGDIAGVVIAAVVFVCAAMVVVVSLYMFNGVRGHAELPASGRILLSPVQSPVAAGAWDDFTTESCTLSSGVQSVLNAETRGSSAANTEDTNSNISC